MSILDGNIFKHLKDIRTDGEQQAYEARIPVFMLLISAANKRLRTWHGVKSIMEYTGYSKTPVTEALAWFEAHGAIYNVPKEARSGHEKRIHGNRKVWQLTGILRIGEQIIDYLLIKDEDRASSLLEIEDHAPEYVKKLFREHGLISGKPEIGLQNEPNLGLQNDTQIIQIGLQNEPEIGLQNDTTKELGKENLVKEQELTTAGEPQVKSVTPQNPVLAKVVALYEQHVGVLTINELNLLKEDSLIYSLDEWHSAIESYKRQRQLKLADGKGNITRPYKYILGILKNEKSKVDDIKAKADATAQAAIDRTIMQYEEMKRKEAEAIARADALKAEEGGETDEPKQRAS